MHNIWAVSEGYFTTDPFLSGGNHLPLAYGQFPVLLGALLHPLLGVYTVAALLAITVPTLWYLSKRVFELIASKRIAQLAAIVVILNPLTVDFYLTAKLPFLWAICFALASVFFYLRGRNLLASLLGIVAILNHPLVMFLLGAFLLADLDLKRWLKSYFLPLSIFSVQLLFFSPPSIHGIADIPTLRYLIEYSPYVRAFVFGAFLSIIFWLKKEIRWLCALGLSIVIVAIIAGFLGSQTLPIAYFDRLGFLLFFPFFPLFVKKIKSIGTVRFTRGVGFTLATFVLVFSSTGMILANAPAVDNPTTYAELPNTILENLREGYVRYVSDGSALYLLPQVGVRFSNSGQAMWDVVEKVDADTYAEWLRKENVSHILIYGEPPENVVYGWYLEEEIILELGYPMIYSADNLRIYSIPRD
jgi:hypothetical protein